MSKKGNDCVWLMLMTRENYLLSRPLDGTLTMAFCVPPHPPRRASRVSDFCLFVCVREERGEREMGEKRGGGGEREKKRVWETEKQW